MGMSGPRILKMSLRSGLKVGGGGWGSGKYRATKKHIGAKDECNDNHGRSSRVIALHEHSRQFTQTSKSQIGQVSPESPSTFDDEPVSQDPMNDGVLVFNNLSGKASKGGPEDLQGIFGIGGNPKEVDDTGQNQEVAEDLNVTSEFPEGFVEERSSHV